MPPKSPQPGKHYRALLELLRAAEALWNASRVFFARWGVSPSQFNVLNLLRNEPGGWSQSELSRALIMHRSNLTGLVDRLEGRGWVVREPLAGDRRAWRVRLTSRGEQLMEEVLPGYYAVAEEVWDGLRGPPVGDLVRSLRRLRQHAGVLAVKYAQTKVPREAARD